MFKSNSNRLLIDSFDPKSSPDAGFHRNHRKDSHSDTDFDSDFDFHRFISKIGQFQLIIDFFNLLIELFDLLIKLFDLYIDLLIEMDQFYIEVSIVNSILSLDFESDRN